MFKFNFLFKFFVFFIPTFNKYRWFLNELTENNIKFKKFLGFVLIKEDDKEFVDYLLPDNFFLIGDVYFENNISSQSLQYIYEKAFSKEEVDVFINLINYITENNELDLLLNCSAKQCECRVIYKDTKDTLFFRQFNLEEAGALKEDINNFICSDVKIGDSALEKLKQDIFSHYLLGFDINFNDYSVHIYRNNGEDFSIILENNTSLKKIVIAHAKVNEKTGMVSFAGSGDGVLYF